MLVGSGVKGRQHASEVGTCRVARMNEVSRAKWIPEPSGIGFGNMLLSVCSSHCISYQVGWNRADTVRAKMSL